MLWEKDATSCRCLSRNFKHAKSQVHFFFCFSFLSNLPTPPQEQKWNILSINEKWYGYWGLKERKYLTFRVIFYVSSLYHPSHSWIVIPRYYDPKNPCSGENAGFEQIGESRFVQSHTLCSALILPDENWQTWAAITRAFFIPSFSSFLVFLVFLSFFLFLKLFL